MSGTSGEVIRDCPACGASAHHAVRTIGDHFTGTDYRVVRCDTCGLMYLRAAPDVDSIGAHYANYSGRNMLARPNAAFRAFRDIAFGMEYGRLIAQVGSDGMIVELGTGDGALANFLRQRDRHVTACDVFPPSAWAWPEIPYRQVDINHLDGEAIAGARAVVMRHVLEHVHYPADLFRLFAAQRVKYVHILVPNTASPWVSFFGEDWCSWDPPRHLQFFEPETLMTMARSSGYVLESATDHGIDELVVSLFRRRMLAWQRAHRGRTDASPDNEWWFKVLQPKSPLCTLSAVLSGFIFKSVLSRLFVLEDSSGP